MLWIRSWQGSKIRTTLNKSCNNRCSFIKFRKNSVERWKFCGTRQISQLGSKFHGTRKTVGPTDQQKSIQRHFAIITHIMYGNYKKTVCKVRTFSRDSLLNLLETTTTLKCVSASETEHHIIRTQSETKHNNAALLQTANSFS